MKGLSDKNAPFITPLKKTYEIAGKKFTFESGRFGLLAQGSVTIRDENDNVLFITAGIKESGVNEKADFFPLVVDYQEKFYATGKIGGNRFQKREGRPSEASILTSRLIDRPIRPMFPKGLINDVQIIASILSSDGISDRGYYGITGASLSLLIAGAPFEGPVSGVKIILTPENTWKVFPNFEEEKNSLLQLLVAGTQDAITMVESSGKEVSQEQMMQGLRLAFEYIQQFSQAQIDFVGEYKNTFGIEPIKEFYNLPDESLFPQVEEYFTAEKLEILYGTGKIEFQNTLESFKDEITQYFIEKNILSQEEVEEIDLTSLIYKRVKEVMRKNVLENQKRLDLRSADEVRKVVCETGVLPRVHGSGLFQRGMTQALSITTLGGPDDVQIIDDMFEETSKRYIHHYNFPPFSVGEVRPLRGVGRREIGHGNLAQKALEPVLPDESTFPYMIRVVSETMTCNGSSSMASVCGSTLSLMQAGVPISAPVAGVAMGMIYDEESKKYVILSDIQAQEDFLGDMDFKVAMTPKGITAMQLDVKISGLSFDVFEQAFSQARVSIDYILSEMLQSQPSVSPQISPYAPLILNIQIPVDRIREVIGKGGENVQRMEKDYLVSISIADDGMTTITAKNREGGEKAIQDISQMIWEPEVGYKGKGKIIKIIDGTGAIVEFLGKTGMIHISKLAATRVEKVEDIVKMGEEIEFEVIEVNKEKGRIGLKRKFEELPKIPQEEKKLG